MPKFKITYEVTVSIDAHSAGGALLVLGDIAPEARAITINDREVIGRCEGCRRHIVDGDEFTACEDMVYLCLECSKEEEEPCNPQP